MNPKDFPPDAFDDDELLPEDDPVEEGTHALPGTNTSPQAATGLSSSIRFTSEEVFDGWKVLIVDDDPSVRLITELALRGLSIDHREVKLFFAATATEARDLLWRHNDIAVALIDVVMESEQAGLELVRWIRTELGNRSLRLVIRTGEPGRAPESSVMTDYDLHDYLGKTDTTSRRLTSCVTGAVRAWRDQTIIQTQRRGLENVLDGVGGLFANHELEVLHQVLVHTVAGLLSPPAAAVWLIEVIDRKASTFRCQASLTEESPPSNLLTRGLPEAGRVQVHEDIGLYLLNRCEDRCSILALKRPSLDPWECNIIELYAQAASLSLRHRATWRSTFEVIERALAEREVMLREIHHRVKNNLQITASILSMQAQRCVTEESRLPIMDSYTRVRAMALVHQQLYAGGDFSHILLNEFCQTLSYLLRSSLAPDARLTLDLVPATVSIDQAIPTGLILNELLTNAFKHGRSPDGTVSIGIRLHLSDEHIVLAISDGGAGLNGTNDTLSTQSLGLKMVHALARQLKAHLSAENNPGACFTLRIPREQTETTASPPDPSQGFMEPPADK